MAVIVNEETDALVVNLRSVVDQEYSKYTTLITECCHVHVVLPNVCAVLISQFVVDKIVLIPDIFDETVTNNDPSEIISTFNKYWNVHKCVLDEKRRGHVAWILNANQSDNKPEPNQLLLMHRYGLLSKHKYRFYSENTHEADHLRIALSLQFNVSMSFEGTADFVTMSTRAKKETSTGRFGGVPNKATCHVVQNWGPSRIDLCGTQKGLSFTPQRGQILDVTVTDTVCYEDRNTSHVRVELLTTKDEKVNSDFLELVEKNRKNHEKTHAHLLIHNRETAGAITSISRLSVSLCIHHNKP